MDLFAGTDLPPAVRAIEHPAERHALAAKLPPNLLMGASTWSYPGWTGQVWAAERPPGVLSRDGLTAYAEHPLFRAAGVDRAFYAPLDAATWRSMADQVPEDFRFVVKAPATTLKPGEPQFLDASWVNDAFVGPLLEGLGPRLGAVVFQFSPFDPARVGGPDTFADGLHRFVHALVDGPLWAIEVRTRQLITKRYAQALQGRATHVITVVPGMPRASTQARVAEAIGTPARVIRWMQHPDWTYAAARDTWKPFRQVAEPHHAVREDLASVIRGTQHPTFVTVGNKAEGCAPGSIEALARAVASGR